MNIEKNPRTFNYLFRLFILMGEEKLGRQLTSAELAQIKPVIAQKCTKLDKKDIVKEIYKLELARTEKEHGHLGIRKRFNLRNFVSQRTNSRVKFTSSSKELTRAVAAKFSRIELSDKYKDTILKSPKSLKDERLTLKNSYAKDVFHYRAPLNTKEKLKRLAILGIAALSFAGIIATSSMAHNPNESLIPEKESTSEVGDTENIAQENNNKTILLEDTIANDLLQDLKIRYADEYNLVHEDNHINPYNLQIRQIHHNYVYQIKTTDSEGKETYKYMTHGSYPAETEKYLESHGYDYTKVSDNYNIGIPVISAVNGDKTELYEAYAIVNFKYVPIVDGNTPQNLEKNENPTNTLYNMNRCFEAVFNDSSKKYLSALKNYYITHPQNALDKNITLELDEPER